MKNLTIALILLISASSFAQSAQEDINSLSSDWDVRRQVNTANHDNWSGGQNFPLHLKYLDFSNVALCAPEGTPTIFIAQVSEGDVARRTRIYNNSNSSEAIVYESAGQYPLISRTNPGFYINSISHGYRYTNISLQDGTTRSDLYCPMVLNMQATRRTDGSYTLAMFRDIAGSTPVIITAYNSRTREPIRIAGSTGDFSDNVSYPGYTGGSTMYGHIRLESTPTEVGDAVTFDVFHSNIVAHTEPVYGKTLLYNNSDVVRWLHSGPSTAPPTMSAAIVTNDQDRRVALSNPNVLYGNGSVRNLDTRGGSIHTIESWAGGKAGIYEARFPVEEYEAISQFVPSKGESLATSFPVMLNGISIDVDYYNHLEDRDSGTVVLRQKIKLTYPIGWDRSNVTDVSITGYSRHGGHPLAWRHLSIPNQFSELTNFGNDASGAYTRSGDLENVISNTFADDDMRWTLEYVHDGRTYKMDYNIHTDGDESSARGSRYVGEFSLMGRDQRINADEGFRYGTRTNIGADVWVRYHDVTN